jgi:uncharacterized protein YndB with AHSA1/START domain
MPTYSASIDIPAPPADVFAYVANLTKHPEWSADPLQITALDSGPVEVGSQYRSAALVQGRTIQADIRVTEHQPPTRFEFTVTDLTGTYTHRFTFQPHDGGTRLERHISATLSLPQHLLFLIVYPLRKRPNTLAALAKLQARFAPRNL